MKLPPEINLIAVSHYLQALEYQRYSNQVVAMLGGKTPHIQNVAVGGVANAINLESEAALNVDRLYQMKTLLEKIVVVRTECLCPRRLCHRRLLSRVVLLWRRRHQLPLRPRSPARRQKTRSSSSPGGFIPNGDLSKLVPITGQKGRDLAPRGHRRQRARLVQGRRPAPPRGKARPIPSRPSGTKTRNTPG